MVRIIISKFELHPKEQPVEYMVGFRFICDANGEELYREQKVPMHESMNRMDDFAICMRARRIMGEGFDQAKKKVQEKSPVVGSIFIDPQDLE